MTMASNSQRKRLSVDHNKGSPRRQQQQPTPCRGKSSMGYNNSMRFIMMILLLSEIQLARGAAEDPGAFTVASRGRPRAWTMTNGESTTSWNAAAVLTTPNDDNNNNNNHNNNNNNNKNHHPNVQSQRHLVQSVPLTYEFFLLVDPSSSSLDVALAQFEAASAAYVNLVHAAYNATVASVTTTQLLPPPLDDDPCTTPAQFDGLPNEIALLYTECSKVTSTVTVVAPSSFRPDLFRRVALRSLQAFVEQSNSRLLAAISTSSSSSENRVAMPDTTSSSSTTVTAPPSYYLVYHGPRRVTAPVALVLMGLVDPLADDQRRVLENLVQQGLEVVLDQKLSLLAADNGAATIVELEFDRPTVRVTLDTPYLERRPGRRRRRKRRRRQLQVVADDLANRGDAASGVGAGAGVDTTTGGGGGNAVGGTTDNTGDTGNLVDTGLGAESQEGEMALGAESQEGEINSSGGGGGGQATEIDADLLDTLTNSGNEGGATTSDENGGAETTANTDLLDILKGGDTSSSGGDGASIDLENLNLDDLPADAFDEESVTVGRQVEFLLAAECASSDCTDANFDALANTELEAYQDVLLDALQEVDLQDGFADLVDTLFVSDLNSGDFGNSVLIDNAGLQSVLAPIFSEVEVDEVPNWMYVLAAICVCIIITTLVYTLFTLRRHNKDEQLYLTATKAKEEYIMNEGDLMVCPTGSTQGHEEKSISPTAQDVSTPIEPADTDEPTKSPSS